MADFCKQCSTEIFGEDLGDLAGLVSEKEWNKGLAACVLCENCGPTQVDPSGACISKGCWSTHSLTKAGLRMESEEIIEPPF